MRYIIGIDEVGRGCLAGPVVVAAAAVPAGFSPHPSDLRDSKQLTEREREAWVAELSRNSRIQVSFARVSPVNIDRKNIANAANLAALRAFQRLIRENPFLSEAGIFLDGGLYLGRRGLVHRALTVVNGDEYVRAIQVASIFAKVHRDRYMAKLARKFPAYGFEINKGYATRTHRQALLKNGPTSVHRLTFIKNYPKISV